MRSCSACKLSDDAEGSDAKDCAHVVCALIRTKKIHTNRHFPTLGFRVTPFPARKLSKARHVPTVMSTIWHVRFPILLLMNQEELLQLIHLPSRIDCTALTVRLDSIHGIEGAQRHRTERQEGQNTMLENGINPFVEKMLDYAARRQDALSDNISNLDTPGYKAKDVQFHNELAGAFSIEDTEAEEQEKPNGNTVNLETQMTSLTQNGLQYVTLVQFLSSDVQSIKYAISEGGKS